MFGLQDDVRGRHINCVATSVQQPLSCMSSLPDACLAFSILQHVPSKTGPGVLAGHVGLFAGPQWRLTVLADAWPAFDIRWGGSICSSPNAVSGVRFCLGGGTNCLTYPPPPSVMMPPTRMSRNSGVGPSVFGISDIDISKGVGWGSPFGGVAP